MFYYLKQSVLSLFYLITMSITAACICIIKSDALLWLKIILGILNLSLYIALVAMASFKDGEKAMRVRNANDLERQLIVKTGEYRPLNLAEEYKPWKGFIFGLITCIPLIALIVAHAIVTAINPAQVICGNFAAWIYMLVYCFNGFSLNMILPASTFYFSLLALPVIVLSTGIPYLLGGRRVEKAQRKIEEKRLEIYGK